MLPYRVLRALFRLIFWSLLTRQKVFGREHVPKTGPYLVLINHISHLDMVLVLAVGPIMKFRYLISRRWVQRALIGRVLQSLGAIPVSFEPGATNCAAVRQGLRTLQGGLALGFAPEATINPPGLLEGKLGAGFFASRVDIPILPIGISNTDRIISNAKRLRRTDVEFNIGKPFKLPRPEPTLGRRQELTAYRHYIMTRIAVLIPARYHGYYADSPALAALKEGNDPWPIIQNMFAKDRAAHEVDAAIAPERASRPELHRGN
jgi:1-acyl-sn-glycerol-3-phosphate acyltransferase